MPSNNTPSQHHYNKALHRREYDVFSPDGLVCYTVPAARIAHYGDEGKRMMVCRNYASGGSCPMGAHCKFVHIDVPLNSLHSEAIHTHYVWRDPSLVTYDTLSPAMAKMRPLITEKQAAETKLTIYGPNNRAPAEQLRAGDLLLTVGAERAFAIAMGEREVDTTKASPHPCHCAHYYFNQVCNRGTGCGFVHVISLNPKQIEARVRHSNFHKRLEAMGAEAKYPLYSNNGDQYTAGYYTWQQGNGPINSSTPMARNHEEGNVMPPPPPPSASKTASPLLNADGSLKVVVGSGPGATSLLPPSMGEPYQGRTPPPPPLNAHKNSQHPSPRAPGSDHTVLPLAISTPSPQWHQSPGQSANQLNLSPSSVPCSVGADIPSYDPQENIPTPLRSLNNGQNTPFSAMHTTSRRIHSPQSAQHTTQQQQHHSQAPPSYAWPPQPKNSPPPLLMESGLYFHSGNNNNNNNNSSNVPNGNPTRLEGYHQLSGEYEDDLEDESSKIASPKGSEQLAASGREGSFRFGSGHNNSFNGAQNLNATTNSNNGNLNNTVSSSCNGNARYSYNPYSSTQVLKTHPSSLTSSAVTTPATRSPAVRPIFGVHAEGTEGGLFPKIALPQAEGGSAANSPAPSPYRPNRY